MGEVDRVIEEDDVVSVLLDAHACGRRILAASLRTLADENGEPFVVQFAGAIHRFVTFTSPLHELDEEQIVLPALRAYGPREEVETALSGVVEEHVAFDALRENLARHWERLREAPSGLGPLREDLLRITEQFVRMHDRHAEHEELVIFPLVRRYVPREKQEQMLAVMMTRRGMGPPGQFVGP
jgi:hemerythrin-like domain-containing protein